ncbi:MAG: PilZ domain-containing protein [Nitrospinota bacterium]
MSSLYLLLQAGAIALIFLVLLVILKVMRSFRGDMRENSSSATLGGMSGALEVEKRRTDRRNIRVPVEMRTPSRIIKGQTKDISTAGAFIQCQKTIPMGEAFEIALNPSKAEPLILNAEVVWSNLNMNDETVVMKGMGIRFLGLTDKDRESIEQIKQ